MFITGRKLKPVVQKRPPVSLESRNEAKILVHIIKGFNVPIRNSAKQDILSHFQGGGGGGGYQRNTTNMMNATRQMDPYNRTAGPGPFPSTFGQLQNNNMMAASAYLGAGGGNQYDPRASFINGGNFNQSFIQPGMNENRLNGVNLNQGYNPR